tara:strand:- start:5849 stop:6454 length:606 start_codon:yes stop_codon:yes gene_type:complete
MRRKTPRVSRNRTSKRKRNTFKRKSVIKKSKKLSGGRGSYVGKGGVITYKRIIANPEILGKWTQHKKCDLEITAQWGEINTSDITLSKKSSRDGYSFVYINGNKYLLQIKNLETFYYIKLHVNNDKGNNRVYILKTPFKWTDESLNEIRGRKYFGRHEDLDSSRKNIWSKIVKIMDYYIDRTNENAKDKLKELIDNNDMLR